MKLIVGFTIDNRNKGGEMLTLMGLALASMPGDRSDEHVCNEESPDVLEDGTRRVTMDGVGDTFMISAVTPAIGLDVTWSAVVRANLGGERRSWEQSLGSVGDGESALWMLHPDGELASASRGFERWPWRVNVILEARASNGVVVERLPVEGGGWLVVSDGVASAVAGDELDELAPNGVVGSLTAAEQRAVTAARSAGSEIVRFSAPLEAPVQAVATELISTRDQRKPSFETTRPLPNTTLAGVQ